MADNYIEKQYEQYLLRKSVWNNKKKREKCVSVSNLPKNEIKENDNSKRVFITGGAQGIGRALVLNFSEKGYRVAFCDKNQSQGKLLSRQCGAMFFNIDISNDALLESCMNRLFKEWGDIDIIINNAAVSEFSDITETTLDEFKMTMNVNLYPVFVTSRLLAIHRKSLNTSNDYGRIINMCSTRYMMSESETEAYSASKGAIFSLTHSLAMSMSKYNVTVNSISPGWIECKKYEALSSNDHEQHPSKRVGKPEDISRMCLFLCDEENDFINGENIVIDGGMTRKMIYM